MIFKTERLIIRLLKKSDIPDFHALQSNPNVMRFVGCKAMSLEENEKDLLHILSCYSTPKNTFWIFAITTNTKTFIGTCALVLNEEYEIGYRFLEKYWGNGYGKEITKGLIAYSFTKKEINTLHAYVDSQNIGSVKILEMYFNFIEELWNEKEQCWERSYIIKKQPLNRKLL